jgi:hypothetical protein
MANIRILVYQILRECLAVIRTWFNEHNGFIILLLRIQIVDT